MALYYLENTLNIFSQIGIIILMGIAAKNGILIVEFAKQLKSEGKKSYDALISSCKNRFILENSDQVKLSEITTGSHGFCLEIFLFILNTSLSVKFNIFFILKSKISIFSEFSGTIWSW